MVVLIALVFRKYENKLTLLICFRLRFQQLRTTMVSCKLPLSFILFTNPLSSTAFCSVSFLSWKFRQTRLATLFRHFKTSLFLIRIASYNVVVGNRHLTFTVIFTCPDKVVKSTTILSTTDDQYYNILSLSCNDCYLHHMMCH